MNIFFQHSQILIIFKLLLLLLLISITISKFPDNITNPELIFSSNFLDFNISNKTLLRNYYNFGKRICIPHTIRIDKYGKLFISIPRHLNENGEYIPGTINILKNNQLYPWPNEKENDFYNGMIHSVAGFEINVDGYLFLLNHINKTHNNILYYSPEGKLLRIFDLSNATKHLNHQSFLSNIVVDLIYNYAYITDTGILFNNSNNTNIENTESNILVVNLEKNLTLRTIEDNICVYPNISYLPKTSDININNIGVYGLALDCSKRTLYFSPVKSNKLYSIRTFKLQEERTIRGETDISSINKNTAGFELTSSARGILYYTSIEENAVLVNFYEREYSFNIIRKIGHELDKFNETKKEFPTSLTFNGTTGYLFYLVNRHNIFINDNINKKLEDENNFQIYKVFVHDRSYLYSCNVSEYMPSYYWPIIVMISMIISFYLIIFMKKVGNIPINENEEKDEELIKMD